MGAMYKQNEMNAYRIAVQLEQTLKKERVLSVKEWLQRLEEIEEQMQTRKFRMAVVGEFNRGKSSFINVLLGKRILPEDVLAATATINRVTYGEKPKAYLIMKDGRRNGQEIPVEELASYVTKLTESSAKAAAEIREAVVEYPTMLCYNGVDLIDTPGMNDMDDMNAITVNQLEDIDLAVVAVNAQYPYSETENRFVVKLLESKKVCQIIFVITHFDTIRDREKKKITDFLYSRIQNNVLAELRRHYEPEDRIFQKYHTIFDDLRLYGISSIDGMEALELNDMELYEKSGFLRLSKELPQVILSSKSVNMLDNIVTLLEEIIGEYERGLLKSRDEWRQWQTVERNLCRLFDLAIAELEELAEGEIRAEELAQAAERQKQDIAKSLLMSLGSIRTMTSTAVQEAMLPAMQQEFRQMNLCYQSRKKQILEAVYKQKWPSALSRLADEVNDKTKAYPRLAAMLKTVNEQLASLPDSLFVEKDRGNLNSSVSGAAAEEFVFYWLESPARAVLDTGENESVLPGLQKTVGISLDECIGKITGSIKKDFAEQILEIKKSLYSYIQVFDDCISKRKNGGEEESELLSELDGLRKECRELHRQIG